MKSSHLMVHLKVPPRCSHSLRVVCCGWRGCAACVRRTSLSLWRNGSRWRSGASFWVGRRLSNVRRALTSCWRGRGSLCDLNAENRVPLGVLVRNLRKNRKCGVCARHVRLTRIWRPYLVRNFSQGTRWRRRRRSRMRISGVAYLEGRHLGVFRRLVGAKIIESSRC